jgi:H+-translocating NAD(P) transhydrogenase subunit alpha
MNMTRTRLTVWLIMGCTVFTAVGLQLAADAWGKAGAPQVELRGQSPDSPIVVNLDLGVDRTDEHMSRVELNTLILYLAIFMLAIFVGFEVITKVPPTLHTPLMSGSNAISGITLIGAIIVAGANASWIASSLVGMLAVALAMINVAGGFLVTHRMLAMFRAKKKG